MLELIRRRAGTVGMLAIAAALTVGGVALAQSESGGNSEGGRPGPPNGKRMAPPMMGLGAPGGKDLTYAEMHVQHNGKEEVVRLDQGKITAVSDSSISLEENDGSEVTIAVDESTKILSGPGSSTSVSELETGQEVTICGPSGGTAKAIMLPPPKRDQEDGQLPPPPGAQMRG